MKLQSLQIPRQNCQGQEIYYLAPGKKYKNKQWFVDIFSRYTIYLQKKVHTWNQTTSDAGSSINKLNWNSDSVAATGILLLEILSTRHEFIYNVLKISALNVLIF